METKELTQRQRWKIVHSDQERERRRLRDKHRRQSMSVEDREKHLARRRRNYQLRRQRDRNPEPELHNDDHTISSTSIQLHPWNENHLPIAVSAQRSVPSDGALHVGCTKRREKLKARKSLGMSSIISLATSVIQFSLGKDLELITAFGLKLITFKGSWYCWC